MCEMKRYIHTCQWRYSCSHWKEEENDKEEEGRRATHGLPSACPQP